MIQPWEMTATCALDAMRARDLSPVELLDSVEQRADEVEPVVNAFTERRRDDARASAQASADRYARGQRIRPLEGLPVAMKEEVPVVGWRMRYGSLAIDEVATETAAIACPTWAVTGIPAGDSYLGTLFEGGGPNDLQFTAYMTTPFNVLSPCPVLAVPSGVASNGVPTGLQIVARTFDDVSAFRIEAALERVRPWAGVAREVPVFP